MLHGDRRAGDDDGASLVRGHRAAREDPYRLGVGLVGLEAMLRLFTEQEANPRAFGALARFLDCSTTPPAPARRARARPARARLPAEAALAVRLPAPPVSCAECGTDAPLGAYSPQAGGAVCRACARDGALALSQDGLAGMTALLGARSPTPPAPAGRPRGARLPRGDLELVRVPRRLPPADVVGVGAAPVRSRLPAPPARRGALADPRVRCLRRARSVVFGRSPSRT